MELKHLKETKTTLAKNLKSVFSSNELIGLLKDAIFFQLIIKLVSILFEIESELKITKKTSEKMLSQLNVISNTHNVFLDVDIKEYFEVKDEINYLDVYLFNIYQKHLDDFVSDIHVDNKTINHNEDSKDEDNIVSKVNTDISPIIPSPIPNHKKETPFSKGPIPNAGTQDFNSKININPQEVQEQVYYQIANQKIMQETKSGIFYIYDSKPKIVPLFKKFFYSAFCLNGLLFLLPFLSLLLAAGLKLPPTTVDGVEKTNVLQTDIFSSLTYLLFSLFSLFYGAKNLLKKESNENLVYYFNWYFFLFVAIFLAFSLFSLINNFSFAFDRLSEIKDLNSSNPTKFVWYELYLYSTIASYSFLGLMSLMAIFMSFLNPKKDVARINEKVSQYVNEIKKQQQQQK